MNNDTKMNVLITGATSGIGKATARLLSSNGCSLILTGRRMNLLEELAAELKSKCPIHILCFDIRNKKETYQALDSLPAEFRTIDVLINNAGLAAGLDPMHQGDTDDWDTMIDTNIKGLLYISRYVSEKMAERKKGQIINLGSIAGKEVYHKGNIYCATKFAVDALTRGLRLDLLSSGIRVTNVAPGLVETEFAEVRFKGDKERAAGIYKGAHPLLPEDVAEVILFVITRPPHVNINDILVMPTTQANSTTLLRD
jgi:NADP-dependent 3-hydroxy acid dehydrogenase YdfG